MKSEYLDVRNKVSPKLVRKTIWIFILIVISIGKTISPCVRQNITSITFCTSTTLSRPKMYECQFKKFEVQEDRSKGRTRSATCGSPNMSRKECR